MIKCIAIDDEPLALDIIQEYCRKISFIRLVNSFDNALEVIDFLKNESVDLMFLDIQMEGITGIQLLSILQKRPRVILTTAYENFALKGYELDISDYLLKPISFERFVKSVNKVYEQITLERMALTHSVAENQIQVTNTNASYIYVRAGSKLVKVELKDVLYIEGQGDYLSIVTLNGKVLTLQNFSNLQKYLNFPRFVRVHKSYLIALDKVEKIEKNKVWIKNVQIPVSETYKHEFQDLIKSREI